MYVLIDKEHLAGSSFFRKTKSAVALILLVAWAVSVGLFLARRIHAAPLNHTYPPDKNIVVNQSFEPDGFSAVSSGNAIMVTVVVTNNEDVALRGFYYSDQVPNGWTVDTAGVSVNGSPVADYVYSQGYADEVYIGFTPHRWALEMPQGDGVFSPTHSIPASGSTAQIVYTMIVSGGTGSDYSLGHDAWAGWLTTTPSGTAVFGYQDILSILEADFTAEPRSGAAPLTVDFIDLSTGDPTTWTWDFGDGSPVSFQQHPTHTYTIPDIYTATLTITRTDPVESDTIVKSAFITVTSPFPTAEFSASPRSGTFPLSVAFTDLSTGDITSWLWDFGDGLTSTIQHPMHTYTVAGRFGVTLTVRGPGGSDTASKPEYIAVGAAFAPPVAEFSASPCSGTVPLAVTFTDLSQGDITTWLWNFGDGLTNTIQHPTHTYSLPGIYTATLTVSHTESMDSDTNVKSSFITVTLPPLQADFTAHPRSGPSPLIAGFTDLSAGDVVTRVWDFGDMGGTLLLPGTVSLPGPTHTYSIPGYYTVSLTVHDAYRSDTLVRRRYIHVIDAIQKVYLPSILKALTY
jgi:PKD repeat protein